MKTVPSADSGSETPSPSAWSRHLPETLAIAFILLIAAGLRIAAIDRVPPGISHDEAMYGLDARDVLTLGVHPIYFERNNGGREPLFIYLGALSMSIFGPTALAMRAVSITVGLATILAGHLLFRRLLGPAVALFASAWLAINFWHLVLSRNSFRAITLPLILTLSLLFLWIGLTQQRRWAWPVGGVFFGLVQYTYFADRVVPLILLGLFVYLALVDRGRWRASLGGLAMYAVVAALVFLPLGVYYWQHPTIFFSRFEQVSGVGGVDPAAPESPLTNVVDALGMFSIRGDYLWGRNIANRPVFDLPGAACFYLGLFVALSRARQPAYGLLLIWSAVMILPTALSTSAPHYLRAVGLIPAIFAFPAIGLAWLLGRLPRIAASLQTRLIQGNGPPLQPFPSQGKGGDTWATSRSPLPRTQNPELRAQNLQPSTFNFQPALRLPVVAALVVWFAVTAAVVSSEYFGYWANRTEVYYGFHSEMNAIGEWLNTVEGDPVVALSSRYYLHPSTLLSLRRSHDIRWFDAAQSWVVPAADRDILFVYPWSARPADLAGRFRGRTPVAERSGPDGTTAFVAYRLSAAEARTLIPSAATPLGTFGGSVSLLASEIGDHATPGETVPVRLTWRVDRRPEERLDLAWFSHLIDRDGRRWGIGDANEFPNLEWRTGDLVVGRYDIVIDSAAPAGLYRVSVGLYDRRTGDRLPMPDGGTTLVLGRVAVRSATLPGLPSILVNERFSDGISLLGYDLPAEECPLGCRRPLRLVWSADRVPGTEYQVFVHVVDQAGRLLRQADGPPPIPTDLWRTGERVEDPRTIEIPPGGARLLVGLYRLDDGRRLPTSTGDSVTIPLGGR